MFYDLQPRNQLDAYISLLQKIGSLSRLFSDATEPYLHYRVAENIFCRAFSAENHSRSDTSADASKHTQGIGLKTFINHPNGSFQKVAEFNKDKPLYGNSTNTVEKMIEIISDLRNKRIDFAQSAHGVESLLYHCVARGKSKFLIFEEKMEYIDVPSIKITKRTANNIYFTDNKADYNFNLTKSTLLKRFITSKPLEFDVEILEDPFAFLESVNQYLLPVVSTPSGEKVFLPLYSVKEGNRYVPDKSGLNQWNAGGRTRKDREVYIRIPLWIHRVFPDFFPPQDQPFNLKLPDGKVLSVKVCQENGKALMSNPNVALGEWLIDQVLKIKSGNIVTYNDLEEVGIDTVEISKIDEHNFEIDFKNVDTFEVFEDANKVD